MDLNETRKKQTRDRLITWLVSKTAFILQTTLVLITTNHF